MTIRLPGFIDIHNHGAVGVDVNSASADDLVRVSRFLATHGVAGWLPTLVPDSDDVYKRVVEAIDEACGRQFRGSSSSHFGRPLRGHFCECGHVRRSATGVFQEVHGASLRNFRYRKAVRR